MPETEVKMLCKQDTIDGKENFQKKEDVSEEVKNSPDYDLRKFQFKQILNKNNSRKSIVLLGSFPYLSELDAAVIILEKQTFCVSDFDTNPNEDKEKQSNFFNDDLKITKEFINNIYGSFFCLPKADLNSVDVTVVYPATEKHIQKYSACDRYIVKETPKLYETITRPFLESNQNTLDWVYNILEHKQEADRIIFEDSDKENGFVLLPDLKWDGKNTDTLYLIAIPHKRHVKSIRDLNGTHLPLLKNIRESSATAIAKRYGLNSTDLRMYMHYQPSFYHMHVHINLIRNDAPGIWCEKSHMLDTIINNLELLPDYYERASIPLQLYEGSKLFDLYKEELHICERSKRENLNNEEGAPDSKLAKNSD